MWVTVRSLRTYYNWRKCFIKVCEQIVAENSALACLRQRQITKDILGYITELRHAAIERQRLDRHRIKAQTSNKVDHLRSRHESEIELMNFVENVALSKVETLKIAGLPRATYYRWRKRLAETGKIKDLRERSNKVRTKDRDDVKEFLFRILHSPPSDYGFNRTTWKQEDLKTALTQSGITLSLDNISSIIRSAGYRWRKAKKVLTSNDPDYRSKVQNIYRILSTLSSDEGFFSIDEYGPFSVKQTSGKKLVPPGERPTIPQWQKSKGSILITAALELSTNQVTHLYSDKKNTDEMIKLLNVLLEEYRHLKTIYLSWDAASWHISEKLYDVIASSNKMAHATGAPHVEVAPLPAGAQFLNVIESVFSGMSRAVIRSSNYMSVDDAKAAIDRHFSDRNAYFLANPQRAGKKIWGSERVPARFLEGQNCKDPRY